MKNQVIKLGSAKQIKINQQNGLYQVKPGDNPVTIATQNGTSVEAFIAANKMAFPLVTGQTVNLPRQKDDLVGSVGGNTAPTKSPFPSSQKGLIPTIANYIASLGPSNNPYLTRWQNQPQPGTPTPNPYLTRNVANMESPGPAIASAFPLTNAPQEYRNLYQNQIVQYPKVVDKGEKDNTVTSKTIGTPAPQRAIEGFYRNSQGHTVFDSYIQDPDTGTVTVQQQHAIIDKNSFDYTAKTQGAKTPADVQRFAEAAGYVKYGAVYVYNGNEVAAANTSQVKNQSGNNVTHWYDPATGIYQNTAGTKGNMSGTAIRMANGNLLPNKARNRRRNDAAQRNQEIAAATPTGIGNETVTNYIWRV